MFHVQHTLGPKLVTNVNCKMKIGFGGIKYVLSRKNKKKSIVAFKSVIKNDTTSVGQHLPMRKV